MFDINFPSLINSCQEAGTAILNIQGDLHIQQKSDQSPVTLADRIAHDILMESLSVHGGELPIISEEGDLSINPGKNFWLVDPLDGTAGFIKGQMDYGVNLALIMDGKAVWGCIHAPRWEQTFVGNCLNSTCQLIQHHNSQILQPKVNPLHPLHRQEKVRILLSINHPDPQTQALAQKLHQAELVEVGSSLKFCALSMGTADWYPRCIGLSEWDLAAGHAIFKAAGGNVWDWDGQEILYGNHQNHFKTKAFEAWI